MAYILSPSHALSVKVLILLWIKLIAVNYAIWHQDKLMYCCANKQSKSFFNCFILDIF